ncbi:hypothetical protein BGX28_010344, partial [Mortierella sp. GBA30]
MDEFFALDQTDPEYDRLVPKFLDAKIRVDKAQVVQDVNDGNRTLSPGSIKAASVPAQIPRGDNIAALIRESNLQLDETNQVKLKAASTKQLRQFLTSLSQQPSNPNSSIIPETGSRK